MADEHRALTALRWLEGHLKAAATRAGDNVEIGRTSAIGDSLTENDTIDINIGPDSPLTNLGTENLYFIDSIQRVFVDLHTRTVDQDAAGVINNVYQMRAQVHAALLASPPPWPAWILSVRYLGTEDFAARVGGDRLGSMRTTWDIRYRMRYSDATAS